MPVAITLDVYRQPLYEYPDTADISGIVLYAIAEDQEIIDHFMRGMIATMGEANVNNFNERIIDGSYSPGRPIVNIRFNTEVDPPEDPVAGPRATT